MGEVDSKVSDSLDVYTGVEITESTSDRDWKPEDYGFNLVKGDGRGSKSVWRKGIFVLMSLSKTLFVMKKEIKDSKGEDVTKIKRVVKWHMVIDRKELADIYFTSGLRG